jgi:imidazolonepropionase-like amidohydrolase
MSKFFERLRFFPLCACCPLVAGVAAAQQPAATPAVPIVLHAARLLHVDSGILLQPGEILVEGDRIRAVGASVERPQGARVIDLGDVTLLPGLIDAHVHLFLHPGSESLQTVQESIPYRTILAAEAAKADLMAGFTADGHGGRRLGRHGGARRHRPGPHPRAAAAHQRQCHRYSGRP